MGLHSPTLTCEIFCLIIMFSRRELNPGRPVHQWTKAALKGVRKSRIHSKGGLTMHSAREKEREREDRGD